MLIKMAGYEGSHLKDFDISQDIPSSLGSFFPPAKSVEYRCWPILNLAINNNPKSIEICGQ